MNNITDKEMIDAYLEKGGFSSASRYLGVSRQNIESRIKRLKGYGLILPRMDRRGTKLKCTPQYIEELNEYVAEKLTER